MTTRPGYVWDDGNNEWVEIGQAAVVSPFKYQATAPTTPSTGDIWIESDVDVPSVDSAQFLRWRKTMTGGETSLSGNDDSSLPLGYTPGYEQLYINGVLMVRGVDYTATTGTTVTGLTALTVNDVVEVFSTLARAVADVYTQTQINSKVDFLPRGVVALATSITDQNTISTVTDLTGLSVTFTGTAGRRYRVSLMLPQLSGSIATDRAAITLTNSANSILYASYSGVNTHGHPIYLSYTTTASGSTTIKARLQRDVGSGTLGVYADSSSIKTLLVEDIGLA
jgi:hypothetical protein